ncbi:hypothetical protein BKA93DRAFT_764706 [Sparassis latifolia]
MRQCQPRSRQNCRCYSISSPSPSDMCMGTQPDSCYVPQHTLSEKSVQRRRNFFIWAPSLRLIGGLHLDAHSPITVASLYRWLTLLLSKPHEFNLYPVEILPTYAIFRYLAQPVGDALPRDSQECLRPGDVGVFVPGIKFNSIHYSQCNLFFRLQEKIRRDSSMTSTSLECRSRTQKRKLRQGKLIGII